MGRTRSSAVSAADDKTTGCASDEEGHADHQSVESHRPFLDNC